MTSMYFHGFHFIPCTVKIWTLSVYWHYLVSTEYKLCSSHNYHTVLQATCTHHMWYTSSVWQLVALVLALVLQKRCHLVAWDLIHILSNCMYTGGRSKHFFFTHCHKGYSHTTRRWSVNQPKRCRYTMYGPLYSSKQCLYACLLGD